MNSKVPKIFSGTVCSGKGIAGKRLQDIAPVLQEKLGFMPFPGTLNLRLNELAQFPPSVAYFDLDKFVAGDKPFRFYRGDICGKEILVARSFSCLAHTDNLLEIISPTNLRQYLGLADGDIVVLTMHVIRQPD